MRWLSDVTVRHLRRVAEWPDLGETKYRLLDELGRGGMGAVYLAEDTVLGRPVALKVVATGAAGGGTAERLWNEARVLARLEHPGIVPVHDAGALPDGRIFYAMKRVDGRRLDELAPDLPRLERLRAFQRLCEPVAFAHARGVVHRDLKPENVMVGPFGEVLVMDWGVAKALGGADASGPPGRAAADSPAVRTSEGAVVGTPAYMAPEQASGSGAVGAAADVYALGGILHFLVTGKAPFDDAGAAARARDGGRAEPPAPRDVAPDVPPALEAIVLRAMALDPGDRYPSVEALAAEVGRFCGGERVLAHDEGLPARVRRFAARYQTPILIVAAYLVMRAVLLLYGRR
ncbi:MAG TPA: serine/threonine-protein kinase [Thermoanaerobaculia bacterium]|nr:serine/threonine-protein kinase [Thermoanaerobaculia bacterium]